MDPDLDPEGPKKHADPADPSPQHCTQLLYLIEINQSSTRAMATKEETADKSASVSGTGFKHFCIIQIKVQHLKNLILQKYDEHICEG
jgi:hypothetical protein